MCDGVFVEADSEEQQHVLSASPVMTCSAEKSGWFNWQLAVGAEEEVCEESQLSACDKKPPWLTAAGEAQPAVAVPVVLAGTLVGQRCPGLQHVPSAPALAPTLGPLAALCSPGPLPSGRGPRPPCARAPGDEADGGNCDSQAVMAAAAAAL